jgi:hypothetical protein
MLKNPRYPRGPKFNFFIFPTKRKRQKELNEIRTQTFQIQSEKLEREEQFIGDSYKNLSYKPEIPLRTKRN